MSALLVTPDSRVCCEAADLIESLQAQHKQAALNYQQKCRDVVELEAQLSASQRRADAAVEMLQTIDWVGSGAKGKIEDAIGALLDERGPQEAGEGGQNE